MANTINSNSTEPSLKERIKALHDYLERFEGIAQFPQAWVHERFSMERQIAIAYIDGKVGASKRAVQSHLKESLESKDLEPNEPDHENVMNSLVHNILLHDQLTRGGRRMFKAPSPSAASMKQYRIHNCVDQPGMRTANGELASKYGQIRDPIPSDVAVMIHEDLAPMAQFIFKWMANPVSRYFVKPSKRLWHLPRYRGDKCNSEDDDESVDRETIEAVANAFVYVLVTLILVAPIAIFNAVESQTVRIAVMPFFCLLLIASAHRMGEESMVMATLATAYVQIMVIYVGTTSDHQAD